MEGRSPCRIQSIVSPGAVVRTTGTFEYVVSPTSRLLRVVGLPLLVIAVTARDASRPIPAGTSLAHVMLPDGRVGWINALGVERL